MQRHASQISCLLFFAVTPLVSCNANDAAPLDSATTSVIDGSLRESASVRVDSSGIRTLVATITVENLTDAPAPLQWSEDCALNGPVEVRVSRGSDVVWDSQRYAPFQGCPTAVIQSFVDPHGSAGFGYQIPVGQILGDSLAPGAYELSVAPTFVSPATKQVPVGQLTLADPLAVPPAANLDGQWAGSTGGLSLSLALTWTADSVSGSGTYTTTTDTGCLEPGLRQKGTVTFAARRQGDVVGGGLAFDVGYDPPYSGRLKSATRFDGKTMNIDTPGCPITLTRAP